jgi:hypothetical protein
MYLVRRGAAILDWLSEALGVHEELSDACRIVETDQRCSHGCHKYSIILVSCVDIPVTSIGRRVLVASGRSTIDAAEKAIVPSTFRAEHMICPKKPLTLYCTRHLATSRIIPGTESF